MFSVAMEIWMEEVVPGEIAINLVIDNLFQNFGQRRENSYWPIVFPFKGVQLLVKWENFGVLPALRKSPLCDGQSYNVMNGLGNQVCSKFYGEVVKLINASTSAVA